MLLFFSRTWFFIFPYSWNLILSKLSEKIISKSRIKICNKFLKHCRDFFPPSPPTGMRSSSTGKCMASLHYLKQDEAILSGLSESAPSSGEHCCYPDRCFRAQNPAGSNTNWSAEQQKGNLFVGVFCSLKSAGGLVPESAQELMDIKSELQILFWR